MYTVPKVTMMLTESDVANTSKIREATNARSNAHAVSIALSVAGFLIDALQKGNELLLRGPDASLQRVVIAELGNASGYKS